MLFNVCIFLIPIGMLILGLHYATALKAQRKVNMVLLLHIQELERALRREGVFVNPVKENFPADANLESLELAKRTLL